MKLNLDTPKAPPPFIFGDIKIGKPFWHIRRKGWGIKMDGITGVYQSNTFMFWEHDSMCCENTPHDEPVIPGKEVIITVESY